MALSLVPGGKYALYPFKIFGTWAHECSHALMAVLLGGQVTGITIAPDTSGLTRFRLPPSRWRESLVASAGYLGSSAAGCALYFASVAYAPRAPWMLVGIGALLLLSALFWVRNLFGALAVIGLGASLLALGHSFAPHPRVSGLLLPFLAVQTGLNAFFDLPALLGLDPKSRSDAHAMRSLLWLPTGFWVALWMGLSLAMMGWTVQRAHSIRIPLGQAPRLYL